MSVTIFNDTFTEASTDTNLESHTPDTGTSWTMLWQTGTTSKFMAKASSDTCLAGGSVNNSGVMYTANGTYPSADYFVEAKIIGGFAGTNRGYLLIRCTDQNNCYALRFSTGATATRIYKKVAGTWTALGSFIADPTVGTTIRIEVSGSTLKYYYNGTLKDTQTDTSLSAAGTGGLAQGGGAQLAASTDDILNTNELDNFVVGMNAVQTSTSVTVTESVSVAVPVGVPSISTSDTSTVTDSVGRLVESYGNVSDTATATESIGRMVETYRNISEPATIAESVSASITGGTPTVNTSDTASTSESVALRVENYVNTSDSSIVSESVGMSLAFNTSLSDATTATESLSHYSDQVDVMERTNLALTSLINVSDGITLTEALGRLVEGYVRPTDTLTVSEAALVALPDNSASVTTSDSATHSEAVALDIAATISASDTSSLSESLSHYSDQVDVNENVRSVLVSDVAASDTSTVSESIGITVDAVTSAAVNKSDTITVTDTPTVVVGDQVFVSANDGISTADSLRHYSDQVDVMERVAAVVAPPDRILAVTDSASLSEQLAATNVYNIAATDTTTVTDNRDVLASGSRSIALIDNRLQDENGGFITDEDGQYITDETPGGDIITTTESIQLFVYTDKTVTVSDTATMTESVALSVSMSISVSDNPITSEALDNGGVPNPNVADSVIVHEAYLNFIVVLNDLPTYDVISPAESISVAVPLLPPVAVTQNISVSENVAVALGLVAGVSDTLSVSEHTEVALSSDIHQSESVTIDDQPALDETCALVVSSSVSTDELVAVQVVSDVRTDDTAALAEDLSAVVESDVSVQDQVNSSEQVALELESTVGVYEVVDWDENVSLAIKTALEIITNDAVTATDTSTSTLVHNIAAADSAVVTDILQLRRVWQRKPISLTLVVPDPLSIRLIKPDAIAIRLMKPEPLAIKLIV